jgi:hypothetical protein
MSNPEINIAYGQDEAALYRGAVRRLVSRAREEGAKFPLVILVTSGLGEMWTAVVTLAGSEFNVKHQAGVTVLLRFPLKMVAIDAQGDTVATLDLSVPRPFSTEEEIN